MFEPPPGQADPGKWAAFPIGASIPSPSMIARSMPSRAIRMRFARIPPSAAEVGDGEGVAEPVSSGDAVGARVAVGATVTSGRSLNTGDATGPVPGDAVASVEPAGPPPSAIARATATAMTATTAARVAALRGMPRPGRGGRSVMTARRRVRSPLRGRSHGPPVSQRFVAARRRSVSPPPVTNARARMVATRSAPGPVGAPTGSVEVFGSPLPFPPRTAWALTAPAVARTFRLPSTHASFTVVFATPLEFVIVGVLLTLSDEERVVTSAQSTDWPATGLPPASRTVAVNVVGWPHALESFTAMVIDATAWSVGLSLI